MALAKPRSRPDLEVVELDGEAVAWDPRARTVHYLNHSAALVLALCDGETTIKGMVSAISDVYETPFDEVDTQVRATLRGLRKLGVLESKTADVESAPPDDRELVRTLVPRSG